MNIKYIRKIESAYTREIELKPKIHIKFFVALTLSLLLVFMLFGIAPASKALIQNLSYKKGLESLSLAMEDKIRELEGAKENLETLGGALENLYGKIPTESGVEDYLKEFVIIAAKNGFVVEKIIFEKRSENETSLETYLSGGQANLTKLTDGIKNLDRMTVAETAGYQTNGKGEEAVRLKIKIYHMEEGQVQ